MKPEPLSSFLSWKPEQRPEVVQGGVLPEGQVMFIYGEYGVFKSWLAMDLAYCVSIGEPWLVYPTTRHRVLIVNTEIGPVDYQKRWAVYTAKRTVTSNGLYVATDMDWRLDTGMGLNEIGALVRQYSVELLVIDNLYSTAQGDISKNSDAKVFIDNCKFLQSHTTPPVAIVIVHHSRQPLADIRGQAISQHAYEMFGSSFFPNWADTIMEVKRVYEPGFSDSVQVSPKKHRLAPFVLDSFTYQFKRQQPNFDVLV